MGLGTGRIEGEKSMKDLIERRAAIDAARKSLCHPGPACPDCYCKELKPMFDLPSAEPQIIRCRDCKHFELNHWERVNTMPLIVAHEICTKWGNGCKTAADGFCFMAERREDQDETD